VDERDKCGRWMWMKELGKKCGWRWCRWMKEISEWMKKKIVDEGDECLWENKCKEIECEWGDLYRK